MFTAKKRVKKIVVYFFHFCYTEFWNRNSDDATAIGSVSRSLELSSPSCQFRLKNIIIIYFGKSF